MEARRGNVVEVKPVSGRDRIRRRFRAGGVLQRQPPPPKPLDSDNRGTDSRQLSLGLPPRRSTRLA